MRSADDGLVARRAAMPWSGLRARRARVTGALAALVALAPVSASATPNAADASDLGADALFERGKALFDAGQVDAACDAFAASERLAPSVGALGLLAACHERQGRLATAWREYVETARRARQRGDERASFAAEHARSLAPRLPLLRIRAARSEPGLEITRAGAPLGATELDTLVALDPADVEVAARAPGKQPWRTVVHLEPGARATVDVPALAATHPREEPPPPQPSHTALTAGYIAIGIGIAAIGIGGGFAADALSKRSQADDHCDPDNHCDAIGGHLLDRAKTSATIATIGIGAGFASGVAGVALIVGDRAAHKTTGAVLRPVASSGGGGAVLSGRF